MKTKSFFFYLWLAGAALAFTKCSGDKHGHGEHDHEHASGATHAAEASGPQFEVDNKFQQQLTAVFASYVDLQKSLVASDAKAVQEDAANTNEALAKVDMDLLSGAAHNDAKNYVASIESSLNAIQASNDIESQRESFSQVTDGLYRSVKAFGLSGEEAFYTYCPMAFNNEGGYWLSDEKKVSNPYFGDKMLTCGEVKEVLR